MDYKQVHICDYVFANTLQRSDWLLYVWISLFPHLSSLPRAPPFSGIPFPVTFLHPIFLSPSSSSSCISNFLIFHLLWATTTYLDALSYSILITTLSSRYSLRSHFFSWEIRLSNLFMGIQLKHRYTPILSKPMWFQIYALTTMRSEENSSEKKTIC